jgi:DNA-binding NtrC family response regulator
VDVRLLVATNRNLEAMVKAGSFREDLFFRIRVVEINLPPLRDRAEDIPVLADHFLHEFAKENAKSGLEFSRSVLEKFRSYSWPGNIRELRTAVEHGVVMTKGQIIELMDLLPIANRKSKLEDLEKEAIGKALARTNQNITEAAKQLGISRRTLHRKLADSEKGGRKKK